MTGHVVSAEFPPPESPPSPSSSTWRSYSPQRRTALVLTGSGTAGAYHAGVLKALHEAGVKIDLVAGRGVGAVGAALAAIDGAPELWAADGLWRSPVATRLYRWRPVLRVVVPLLGLALAAVVLPLGTLALAALVYPVVYLLGLSGIPGESVLTTSFSQVMDWIFASSLLPTWSPRLVFVALLLPLCVACGAIGRTWLRGRGRRRMRGAVWWTLVESPIDAASARGWLANGLWKLLRGAATVARPSPAELGNRYSELLSENLGQPGFRELLITAHDLDGRRDLTFALLSEPYRGRFFRQAPDGDRQLETLDLAGAAGRCGFDACAAALSLPVVTEPWLLSFGSGSRWRRETHRLCDRPDGIARLLDEVARAGAQQVILVSALAGPAQPHTLAAGRRDGRGRIGEALSALESAAVRDAVASRSRRFEAVFEIRPRHNPLGPFDFAGCYDERSDRYQTLEELLEGGYEDGYSQFVEPVVGASGEQIGAAPPP